MFVLLRGRIQTYFFLWNEVHLKLDYKYFHESCTVRTISINEIMKENIVRIQLKVRYRKLQNIEIIECTLAVHIVIIAESSTKLCNKWILLNDVFEECHKNKYA